MKEYSTRLARISLEEKGLRNAANNTLEIRNLRRIFAGTIRLLCVSAERPDTKEVRRVQDQLEAAQEGVT